MDDFSKHNTQDLGEYLWDLDVVRLAGVSTFTALTWAWVERVITEYVRAHPGQCSFGVSLSKPYTMGLHGEHGMADGADNLSGNVEPSHAVYGMAPTRPIALGESKECVIDCTCSMGAASPVHYGYCVSLAAKPSHLRVPGAN